MSERPTSTADVVVVGAGVIGAALTYHLARAGLKAVLVDRRGVAAGATGSSLGLVRVHNPDPAIGALATAAWPDFARWDEPDATGTPLTATGCVRRPPDEELARLPPAPATLSRSPRCALVSGEPPGSFPEMAWPEGLVAVWEPDAGYADPARTAASYADRAAALGAGIWAGTDALELCERGGRLRGVGTSRGFLSAPRAVVSGGAWMARSPLPGLGLPLRTRLIVSWRFRTRPRCRLPAFIDEHGTPPMHFRPDGPDRLLVGTASLEHEGSPDRPPCPPMPEALRRRLEERLPGVELRGEGAECGVDAYTDDRLPIVDRWPPVEGVWVATGFSGGGFKVAPAVGRSLAGWVRTGRRPRLLSPFAVDRFAGRRR